MILQISRAPQTPVPLAARAIARLLRSAMDLLYPPQCPLCYMPGPRTDGQLCLDCTKVIDGERRALSCPTCAASVTMHEVANRQCGDCRRRPTRIQGSARVGAYGRFLGHLVRAYKFARREELEPLLGGWLVEAIEATPWRGRVQAVIPVPTHWRRRITRTIYPAERLATFVAGRLDLPHVAMLRRVRHGPHQIGLSYTARVENVRGAFAVRPGVKLDNARLLIVDDVKTTGATMNECAKVLRRAGASEVYSATIVKAGWMQGLGGPLSSI